MSIVEIGDKVVAEDIQRILEESNIYSILDSDNPASSVLNIYSGLNAIENLAIRVNNNDYLKAIEAIRKSHYKDLLTEA